MSAPGPSTTPKVKRSPYVGPRAFRKGEPFFGREVENVGVQSKLLPAGVMILYAPSGAGKTSLIQAAVVPEFAARGFQICAASEPRFAALRVNLPPPPDLTVDNQYVFSVVNGLVGHLVERDRAATMTIEAALDLFEREGPAPIRARSDGSAGSALDPDRAQPERPKQLAVFDQMEEVLTLRPTDIAGQREFFRQLGSALRRGRRWALLAIREDYLGGLDQFKGYFQSELRAAYRVDFLHEEAAVRAVQELAAARGVTFEDAAARALIGDLREVRGSVTAELLSAGPRPDDAGRTVPTHRHPPKYGRPVAEPSAGMVDADGDHAAVSPGNEVVLHPYVELVLLQIMCDRLWRVLSRERRNDFVTITTTDLNRVKPYSAILSKYYRDVVTDVADGDPEIERSIREWIEKRLLTKQGMRRPTLAKPKVPDPDAVMAMLSERYLIRDDPRPGGTWWELVHDMLVDPVIEDNRAWRLSHLEPWQIVADEWQRAGRPPGFALHGSVLREALAGAKRRTLTSAESAFLEESRRVADDEGRRARLEYQRNFLRIGLVLSLLVNLVLLTLYMKGG